WVAARAAAAAGKPYVITPHGTFMEHWRYRSAKKRAYRALLLRDVLPGAAAMHVLSEREQQACRDAGITCPLAVIPNGLAEGAFATARGMQRSRWCGDPGRKYLVYLGRLWHEKGLDLLVEAWAGARRGGQLADWDLVVAGADFRGYRAELERRIGELQVASSVRLVGEVHGEDKAALLRFADAFVQPSRSEALSMSLLEAMAAGLPCVYTTGCNLPSLAECGGGIETAVSAADLQQGLLRVAGLAGEERAAMGQRGRRLALQHYSEQAVMQQLERLYADILEWAAPAAAGPPLLRGELAG
ncbi:MAG TPA: glycosyltransferase, partial [Ramlibacter sp.]|nr:glycosyltransferase [Ramlibacter sp.]